MADDNSPSHASDIQPESTNHNLKPKCSIHKVYKYRQETVTETSLPPSIPSAPYSKFSILYSKFRFYVYFLLTVIFALTILCTIHPLRPILIETQLPAALDRISSWHSTKSFHVLERRENNSSKSINSTTPEKNVNVSLTMSLGKSSIRDYQGNGKDWVRFADALKKPFIHRLQRVKNNNAVSVWINQNGAAVTVSAILMLGSFLTLIAGRIISKYYLRKPERKIHDTSTSDGSSNELMISDSIERYTFFKSVVAWIMMLFALILLILCSYSSSLSASIFFSSLTEFKDTLSTAIDEFHVVVNDIPDAVHTAVTAMTLNFNSTINDTVRSINTVPTQQKLGIPNQVPGPGVDVIGMLVNVSRFVGPAFVNASLLDAYVQIHLNDGNYLSPEIIDFNNDIQTINLYKIPTSPSILTLRNPLVPIPWSFPEALTNISLVLIGLSQTPITPLLNPLRNLPPLLPIIDSLTLPLTALDTMIEVMAAAPMRASAYAAAAKAESDYIPTVIPYLNWVNDVIDQYKDMILGMVVYGGWGAAIGGFSVVGVFGGWAAVVMSVVGMGAARMRKERVFRWVVWTWVFAGYVMMFTSGILLLMAVAIDEACDSISNDNATVVVSLQPALENQTRAFLETRVKCVNGENKLLPLMYAFGVQPNYVNFTVKASYAIETFNYTKYTSFNINTLIPPNLKATTASFTNISSDTTTAASQPLDARIKQFLYDNIDIDMWKSSFSNVESNIDSLISSLSSKTLSTLNDVYIGTIPVNMTENDVSGIKDTVKILEGRAANITQELMSLGTDCRKIYKWLETIHDGVVDLVTYPQRILDDQDEIINLFTDFLDSTSKNLTEMIPQIKRELYKDADVGTPTLEANLHCKKGMEATLLVQDSVCVTMSAGLTALWLSFMIGGLTILICLTILPFVWRNVLISRGVESDPPVLVERSESLASTDTLFAGKKKRGKQQLRKISPMHLKGSAVDLISQDPTSEDWTFGPSETSIDSTKTLVMGDRTNIEDGLDHVRETAALPNLRVVGSREALNGESSGMERNDVSSERREEEVENALIRQDRRSAWSLNSRNPPTYSEFL